MGGVSSPGGLTFYIDASLPLQVRQALKLLRDDVVVPGEPGRPAERSPDREWLTRAGSEDWVVILRDKRIRRRPGERDALRKAGVRAFVLTGAGNYTRWQIMALLTARWAAIERVALEHSGPYIYSVTQGGVERLSLPSGPRRRFST